MPIFTTSCPKFNWLNDRFDVSVDPSSSIEWIGLGPARIAIEILDLFPARAQEVSRMILVEI